MAVGRRGGGVAGGSLEVVNSNTTGGVGRGEVPVHEE